MCVWCVWWCVYTHGVCVYMYMCMWCECVCSVVYPDINPTLIAIWCLLNGTGYRTYDIAFKDQCECEFRTATAAVTPFTLCTLIHGEFSHLPPSIDQRKYYTCTHGGGHWLQLGVFPSAIGANTPCTSGGATRCNLHWWSFSFHPMAHIIQLCSSNVHCEVVVCSDGSFMWMWRWCTTYEQTWEMYNIMPSLYIS